MIHIFCDFDGTITSRDSIVVLTEELGGGKDFRRSLIDGVKDRSVTSFEAIERELASVRVSWKEAKRFLQENISMDPEFPPFVQWCRKLGYSVSVLSSGIEQIVATFIGHLDIPYFAHPIEVTPKGWVYRKREENDKVRVVTSVPEDVKTVYVGDGTSDIEVLPYVDILFAKSYLAEYCRTHGQAFFPFDSFRDVRKQLTTDL